MRLVDSRNLASSTVPVDVHGRFLEKAGTVEGVGAGWSRWEGMGHSRGRRGRGVMVYSDENT